MNKIVSLYIIILTDIYLPAFHSEITLADKNLQLSLFEISKMRKILSGFILSNL